MFLDEPTNHLDIYTRESLTQALMDYEGTLLLVTHDRYLMNSLACPILYIEEGRAALYESYEKLMARNSTAADEAPKRTRKRPGGQSRLWKRAAPPQSGAAGPPESGGGGIEQLGAHLVELENEINSPEVLGTTFFGKNRRNWTTADSTSRSCSASGKNCWRSRSNTEQDEEI